MSTVSKAPAIPTVDLKDVHWTYTGDVVYTSDLEVARQLGRRLRANNYTPAVNLNSMHSEDVYVFVYELWPDESSVRWEEYPNAPDRTVKIYYFTPSASPEHQPRWAVCDTQQLPGDVPMFVFDTFKDAQDKANSMPHPTEFQSWEIVFACQPVLHL